MSGTIALADVCDLDCIASLAPLVLDLPATAKYRRGQWAILARVVYAWCRASVPGVPTPPSVSVSLQALEGTRWDRAALMRYRVELEGVARQIAFVSGASVPLMLSTNGSILRIPARIDLVTGVSLPLEVSAGDAPAAILAFGAAQQ